MNKSKSYNKIKLVVSVSRNAATFVILLFFVWSELSSELYLLISPISGSEYLRLLLFTFIAGALFTLLFLPLDYYSGFYIEHKFGLSNQTTIRWFLESIKGMSVGIILLVPVILAFYFSIITFGDNWWVIFAAIIFVFSVLLARIAPIIILPLFYKITPIDDEDLRASITRMGSLAGLDVKNVYRFDMSKNTKKANAAFTGIGKSKKIILGDTLLADFSKAEIETVIAHEMGHYKNKHIIKGIILSTIFSFISFYLIATVFSVLISVFGFSSITQIAALPLIIPVSMFIGLAITPINNAISRRFEYEADNYAVALTDNKSIFQDTLRKLTDKNLGDPEPHPIVEWFFYSHPSVGKRIAAIEKL